MSALRKVVYAVKLFLASPHTITRFPEGADILMKLFMAGGVTGNLNPFWKEACRNMAEGQPFSNATEDAMKIFLAGGESRHWIQDNLLESQKKNEMRIYLAGNGIVPAYIAPEIRNADLSRRRIPERDHTGGGITFAPTRFRFHGKKLEPHM